MKLLDTYISKLVPNATHFYMRPLPKVPTDTSKPWCTKQRVGINTIKDIVPKICAGCELENTYTNHSLRATATTRIFTGNIPEKVIADKSSHRSIKGLRFYEKTSALQEIVAGEVVSGRDTTVIKEEPDHVSENKKSEVPGEVVSGRDTTVIKERTGSCE